jgi:hypothetical protein
MAINTQRLYDAKAVKFGTSVESETFMSVFLESLLKTCTDLQNFTGMPITSPADVLTDVAIAAEYYSVISYGLDFYLQDSNQFTANPIPDAEDRFIRAKKEAQRIYLQTQDLGVRFGTLESSEATEEVLE